MDPIRASLKKNAQAFEIYRIVERVEFYRHPGGQEKRQRVTMEILEILDRGSQNWHSRFWCRATSDDGHEANGNPAESVDVAISNLRWDEFDREVR
ncbi:MAG: hypothetical protein ACHQ50_16300 [Fimbriimonadales bacterium]